MIRFLHHIQIATIVFWVTLAMATWNLFMMFCEYAYLVFSLPVDSWERAKVIGQRLIDEDGEKHG